MVNILIGAVLISAQLFIVSIAPIAPAQVDCVEGEPLQGQRQPDVNITALPSLEVPSLSPVTIICDADVARFPPNLPPPPTAPVKIVIRVGIYTVKECANNTGIFQCTYRLSSFFPGLRPRISCTASTDDDECRFKTANLTIQPTPTPTESSPSVKEGSTTNVTSSRTSIFLSTSIVESRDVISSPTSVFSSTSILRDRGSSNEESASNIGVIVGVVAGVVVLVIVVSVVAFCFYQRKRKGKNTKDIPDIKNAAFEADAKEDIGIVTNPSGKSSDAPNSDGLYEELDSAKREPFDENYQSLVTGDYEQLDRDPYDDVKAYASLNKNITNRKTKVNSETLSEEVS